jgi:phosphoglycolate phosphatase
MMQTTEPNTESRISIKPGFAWDGQDACLFDIDGTLMRSRDRIHVESFPLSIRKVTGFEVTLTGVMLQGNTDTALLRKAFLLSGSRKAS